MPKVLSPSSGKAAALKHNDAALPKMHLNMRKVERPVSSKEKQRGGFHVSGQEGGWVLRSVPCVLAG